VGNKLYFDYRLVLKEDPSFKAFVDIEAPLQPERCADPFDPPHRENALLNRQLIETDSEIENEIIEFVHDKIKDTPQNTIEMVDEVDIGEAVPFDRYAFRKVQLKKKYEDPPNPNYDSSILQLTIPNRFLLPGSEAWQGDDTLYIYEVIDDQKFVSRLRKFRFSQGDHFIRLQRATYRFDRKRNATNEIKKYLNIWTYNTNTRQLYHIRKVKNSERKKSHFHTTTRKIFNILFHSGWSGSGMPECLSNKFVNTIKQAAIKDVPGLIIPTKVNSGPYISKTSDKYKIVIPNNYVEAINDREFQSIKLAAIILQHRVGQPIPWLNPILIENLWKVLGDKQFQEISLYGTYRIPEEARSNKGKKASEALRKKTVFQLVPNLKKSNHMKTAIKTILGKDCSKFLIKLLNMSLVNNTFLSSWINATHNGLVSKNLYHWVANTVNSNTPQPLINHVIANTDTIIGFIARNDTIAHNDDGLRALDSNFVQARFSVALDSYIKICRRLVNEVMPDWHHWYDIYVMADQLGVRIRPNRLKTSIEIRNIHDKLSDIIRRDRSIMRKYKNLVFEEFTSPEKEYDGFKFIQMRTAQDLVDEGTVMKHCVASYTDRCAEGRSIIFSMRKNDKSYVTTELDPRNYTITQQYTLHDITVTSQKVLDIINRWNNDCLELHKNDKESYYDKCYKKIKAYLDKERAVSLKELVESGMAKSESQILKDSQPVEEGLLANAAAF